MIRNKNAISPVVATALLLVVAVLSTIGFGNWYNSYSSSINSNVEKSQSTGLVKVEDLTGDFLYISNPNGNLSINNITIDNFNCNISGNYTQSKIKLDVSLCLSNKTSQTPNILVVTKNSVARGSAFIPKTQLVRYGSGGGSSSSGGGTPPISCSPNPIFNNGTGTALDPYQICDCTQLQNMSTSLSSSYELINNVDCSATVNWNGGLGFSPIGSLATPFTGNLNGNSKTISSLFINQSPTAYVGLFGYSINSSFNSIVFNNVTLLGGLVGSLVGYSRNDYVNNILVLDSNLSGYSNVGGILGSFYGIINNSNILNSQISGYTGIGGIAGNIGSLAKNSSVENSYSQNLVLSGSGPNIGGISGVFNYGNLANVYVKDINLSGTSSIGGILGSSYKVYVDNSYSNNVKISGTFLLGGLIGSYSTSGGALLGPQSIINSYTLNSNIQGSYNLGGFLGLNHGRILRSYAKNAIIIGSSTNVGGLVGYNKIYAIINSSYSSGNVSGTSEVGGLVGHNYKYSKIDNSYSSSNVSGTLDVGGLVGYNYYYSNVDNSYATGNVSGTSNVGGLVGYNHYYSNVDNSYFNNHGGNPGVAIGLDDGLGIVNIFAIADNISYFYLNSNSPMTLWNTSTWAFSGIALPTLN